MNSKKWIVAFFIIGLFSLSSMMAFNALADPFGVFGDRIMNWYSYNFTQNPRVSKVSFIARNPDMFDSFIIGPSGASAFPTYMLEEHMGGRFFNMFAFGGDMRDIYDTARWLIENINVENLVLSLYIDSAINYDMNYDRLTAGMHAQATGESSVTFFWRYLTFNPRHSFEKITRFRKRGYLGGYYNWFDPLTGAYDKRRRAAEPIGCLQEYLWAYPVFMHYPTSPLYMENIDNMISRVKRIRELADAAGVNLLVIFNPIYADHLKRFCSDEVKELFTGLADTGEFWDFSITHKSFDPRFFYDATHFRHAVGAMAVGRIFGCETMFIPENFGELVTPKNAARRAEEILAFETPDLSRYTANIPILMYHHLCETEVNNYTVTPRLFAEHMQALYDAGFNTVSLRQLVDFVDYGIPLPENPIAITFDDGYLSVYKYAFPVLRDLGFTATSFVIGEAVGTDTYKDTGHPTTPKFCFEQARTMAGVVSIQSHSYDMHQWPPFEPGRPRTDVLIWPDECEFEYVEILRADHRRVSELIYTNLGEEVFSIAFPLGRYDELSTAVLQSMGVRLTLGVRPAGNTIIMGLPQSLLSLNRLNMTECISGEALLMMLKNL